MSDMADGMLDGTFCQICGVLIAYVNDDSTAEPLGYPDSCETCLWDACDPPTTVEEAARQAAELTSKGLREDIVNQLHRRLDTGGFSVSDSNFATFLNFAESQVALSITADLFHDLIEGGGGPEAVRRILSSMLLALSVGLLEVHGLTLRVSIEVSETSGGSEGKGA